MGIGTINSVFFLTTGTFFGKVGFELGVGKITLEGRRKVYLYAFLSVFLTSIAFYKEMVEICGRHGIDMKCISEWNRIYNEGVAQTGNPHLQRPVMWVDDKPIGGHCVVPNAHILRMLEKADGVNEEDRSLALKLILKYAPKGDLNGHLDSSS